MDDFLKAVGGIVVALAMLAALALLMALPTKWMVNYLFTASAITGVFGVAKISVYQAFWLNWLCGTLFKSSSSKK